MQMMMQVMVIRRLCDSVAVHRMKETIVETVQLGRRRLVIRAMVIAGTER